MQSSIVHSSSPRAQAAWALVKDLQASFAQELQTCLMPLPCSADSIAWRRDQGRCGGGDRMELRSPGLNSCSINVSQVQYEQDPLRPLQSATALSSIVHPDHPLLPSIHIHISWTELKANQSGYWRIMADLNPAIVDQNDAEVFDQMLRNVGGDHYDIATSQGDKYFYIPALQRHRGVKHFYLEQFATADFEQDLEFAQNFGQHVIQTYTDLWRAKTANFVAPTADQRLQQLDYHTLYFFQVLTLDRGTTAGLLVHSENDLGILGSLPRAVSAPLLNTWTKLPHAAAYAALTADLMSALNCEQHPTPIDAETKLRLAQTLRTYYRDHPGAWAHQASGFVQPATVAQHLQGDSRVDSLSHSR